jgi:hypothetical protein
MQNVGNIIFSLETLYFGWILSKFYFKPIEFCVLVFLCKEGFEFMLFWFFSFSLNYN